MFEEMAWRIQEAPEIIPTVVLSALLLLASLGLLGIGFSRLSKTKRDDTATAFSAAPEVFAVLCLVGPILTTLYAWRSAAYRVPLLLDEADASQKASLLASAIATQLNADAFLSLSITGYGALVAASLGLLTAARFGRRGRAPQVLAGAGASALSASLPVLAVACLRRTSGLINGFGAIAAADPNEKATILVAVVEETRGILTWGATAASVCAVLGLLLLATAIVISKPRVEGSVKQMLLSGGAFLMALVLFFEARPFAQENAMPIAFSASGDLLPPDAVAKALALDGPDELQRAAVVVVNPTLLSIEGIRVDDPDDLTNKLQELRRVEDMMYPGRSFEGRLTLVVQKTVSSKRMFDVLAAAGAAGYKKITLGFRTTGVTQSRPIFGTRTESHTSGVRIDMSENEDAVDLSIEEGENFETIAPRLIAARKRQETVRPVRAP